MIILPDTIEETFQNIGLRKRVVRYFILPLKTQVY